MKEIELWQGDCLELMKNIPDGSVDLILTDPPYGTVKNIGSSKTIKHGMKNKTSWDECIDHEKMLKECNRILRHKGCLIIFSQDPYTSKLMTQCHFNLPFSYRLTWVKDHFANSLIAKVAPVKYTEDICVFFKKSDSELMNPLRDYSKKIFNFIGDNKNNIKNKLNKNDINKWFSYNNSHLFNICSKETYDELEKEYDLKKQDWFKEYDEILEINNKFSRCFNLPEGKKIKPNILYYKKDYTGMHPTQKPVALLEDLIYTYTHPKQTVLDFTMGSGSTGVACKNINRNFIGIELDEKYFNIAKERIENHKVNKENKE